MPVFENQQTMGQLAQIYYELNQIQTKAEDISTEGKMLFIFWYTLKLN